MNAKDLRRKRLEETGVPARWKIFLLVMVLGLTWSGLMATQAFALEIITEEDVRQEIVTTLNLVKTSDNAIFLFDTSSSMAKPLEGTGTPRLEELKRVLKDRIKWFPELGYNFGLYVFTPWKPLYPIQPFDRQKVADAIDQLPTTASGETFLLRALDNLDPVLEGLSGRTVVFLFSDGQYMRHGQLKRPWQKARDLARKYNVCFYVLSTAVKEHHEKTLQQIADVNECSRVIPFVTFVKRPAYNSGALFVVDAQTELVTVNDKRVVGLRADDILFAFNSTEILPEYHDQLRSIGEFLQKNPQAYVVMHGYADNLGPQEYNLKLSHRRVESVAAYLASNFDIGEDRMVVMWYGALNPVVGNDTEEGRRRNRRVEIAVGLE